MGPLQEGRPELRWQLWGWREEERFKTVTEAEASASMLDKSILDNFQARGTRHSLKKIWTEGIR